MPFPRPTLPKWAAVPSIDSANQPTVVEPPEERKDAGWTTARPEYNIMNWLFRQAYLWLQYIDEAAGRTIITDGNGVGVAPIDDALVELTAVDSNDPTHYLHAVGYKPTGGDLVLNVVSNDTLTLGTTAGGTQPISGGTAADIIVRATSRKDLS